MLSVNLFSQQKTNNLKSNISFKNNINANSVPVLSQPKQDVFVSNSMKAASKVAFGNNLSSKIIKLTDDNFNKIVKSCKNIIVDFHSPGCGPCRAQRPILEDLAKDIGNKVTIATLDVSENAITPAKYNIRSIPHFLFFEDGEVKARTVGLQSKAQLKKIIDKNFNL